ncbi:hypothetical protein CPC16_004931 [Podila verticillata]|nr:hypothetical protein CPC16_004931 [Podila verticillata]
MPSLNTLGLKAATLKNLVDDRTHELYLPKVILGPLISGKDVILQLQGSLLDDYVSYTLVNIIDQSKPKLCIMIIVDHIKDPSIMIIVDHFKDPSMKWSTIIMMQSLGFDWSMMLTRV